MLKGSLQNVTQIIENLYESNNSSKSIGKQYWMFLNYTYMYVESCMAQRNKQSHI